ncbi:taste receptor type 2 member 39-like [Pseudophryne corroboree]|uniref:taste receptor type 2 member 39-like n=1 Tax=Pseudophryne corroboree TaxID=495146 RepID=UPI00308189D9
MDINLRSPGIVTSLIILSIEVFAAIFTYAFITYGILCDFHKKKHLPPAKKIQCAVHLSSICFTIVSYANLLCEVLWPDLCKTLYSEGVFISLTVYSVSSCAWFTALVSFFYFTKIADVRSGFLGWTKKMINYFAHYLIVVIHVLCLVISFLNMLLLRFLQDPSTNSSVIPPASSTFGTKAANLRVAKFTLAMISVPFLTMIINVLLTGQFLKLHEHTMGKNMAKSGDDTLKIYQNIVSQMIHFLFLYAAFYLVFFLFYFSSFSQQSPGYWVTMILMLSFTPIQFVMIIIHYPNVNKNWKELLQYFI